jgi:DNA-binding FrmR family transcriptional regulator
MAALPAQDMEHVIKRLRRAQGQIGGVLRMIEEGRDCQDVVTQLAAASRVLDPLSVRHCLRTGGNYCEAGSGGADSVDSAKKMEKLFLSLA